MSCNLAHERHQSREVIWGGRITAAKLTAEQAHQRAIEAVREADRRRYGEAVLF